MVMELNFETFWKHYDSQKKIKDKDFRRLHFEQKSDRFVLYLKSVDYWEYRTEILFSDLTEFSSVYGGENGIEDFKKTVLFDAMPLKKKEVAVMEFPEEDQESITKEAMIVEEAKEYDQFLSSTFKSWEQKIMGFVDKNLKQDLQKDALKKTFASFLQDLFNTVNTNKFFSAIKRVIKLKMKTGLEEAEKELEMDVGIGVRFEQKLNVETSRQLDGFYMSDGKRWKGLKGVSNELQFKISEIVSEGIGEGKTTKEVKREIRQVMTRYAGGEVEGKITQGRAMTIARTESNRFVNAGRLAGYKDSGVVKKKRWDSQEPRGCRNCTKVCDNLNGMVVGLDEKFVDPDTNIGYDHPPALPNCRSVVRPVL